MYSDTYLNENFKQGGIGDISAQTASKLMKYQNNQAYSFDKNNIDEYCKINIYRSVFRRLA